MLKSNKNVLVVSAIIVILLCVALCVFFSFTSTVSQSVYKKFIFNSEIPATWSLTSFGPTAGVDNFGKYDNYSMTGVRELSVSPQIVSVGEETHPQANFYHLDPDVSVEKYVAAAQLQGAKITKEKVGDVVATVVRDTSDGGKSKVVEYLIQYLDKDKNPKTLFISKDVPWSKNDEGGFEHFLNKALFMGSEPNIRDFDFESR